MGKKICSNCKIEKTLCDFGFRKNAKDGRRGVCKICHNEKYKNYVKQNQKKISQRQKQWQKNNREKIRLNSQNHRKKNIDVLKEKQKKYYWENKQKRLDNHKKWYDENREYAINKTLEWQEKNKERINKNRNIRHKERWEKDILYRIKMNMRNRIKHFIKSKNFDKIRNGTFNVVGINPEELKKHIEKQFKNGMNWENYGQKGWHIDHIIPLSSAKTEEDVYRLCEYTNLQPLWSHENYKKGNKI